MTTTTPDGAPCALTITIGASDDGDGWNVEATCACRSKPTPPWTWTWIGWAASARLAAHRAAASWDEHRERLGARR